MVKPRASRLWMLFAFLFFFLLWSRLWNLGDKPYHHDEGIYSTLSLRFAEGLNYRFDPVTHGPFLFTFEGLMFRILRVSDYTARLPVALAGILLPLCGLILLRKQSTMILLSWFVLSVFSPSLCYFSRFLGMDSILAWQAVAFLALASLWWETGRDDFLFFTALFLAFLICTKLNWLFYVFSFASFAYFSGDLPVIWQRLKGKKKDFYISTAIVAFVFCLLYSTLGTNPRGIWDGLFGKMIPYWINQNKIQRVAGPFHFYLTLIAIYELPLVLMMFFILWRLIADKLSRKFLMIGTGIGFGAWALCALFWNRIQSFFAHHVHMTSAWHPSLLVFEISLCYACLKYHLAREEKWQAFFSYWMFISLILYSYAGEKIPWLMPHMVLPAYLYLSSLIGPLSKPWQHACAIVIIAWQGFNLARSSFIDPANPKERLVYTHTTEAFANLVHELDAQRIKTPDLSIQIFGTSEAVWPSAWYLRNYVAWFRPTMSFQEMPNVVITNWEKAEETRTQLFGPYYLERIPLRSWWIPDPMEYGFKNFVSYYFTHENFNPTGSTDIAVFIRPNTFR